MPNLQPQPLVVPSSVGPVVGRFFSLSGLVPLGAFLLGHLYENVRHLTGEPTSGGLVDAVNRFLLAPLAEWLLVFTPLAFHALLGLWLPFAREPILEPRPYPPGLRTAMRATGIITLAFVAVHLWASASALGFAASHVSASARRLQVATRLAADLSATWHGVPWSGMAYLVGGACVSFHFVVGCWGFFATTRAGRGPRSRRWAGWGAGAVGIAMAALFANTVVYYATGARLLGNPHADAGGQIDCPEPPPPRP